MAHTFSTRDVFALIPGDETGFTVKMSEPSFEDDGRDTAIVTMYSTDGDSQEFAVTVIKIGKALNLAHKSKEHKDNVHPDGHVTD